MSGSETGSTSAQQNPNPKYCAMRVRAGVVSPSPTRPSLEARAGAGAGAGDLGRRAVRAGDGHAGGRAGGRAAGEPVTESGGGGSADEDGPSAVASSSGGASPSPALNEPLFRVRDGQRKPDLRRGDSRGIAGEARGAHRLDGPGAASNDTEELPHNR